MAGKCRYVAQLHEASRLVTEAVGIGHERWQFAYQSRSGPPAQPWLEPDIVECLRIAQMIERHGELFITRIYTDAEVDYCRSRLAATQHYAGRWAAKEAAMKALGTGFIPGVGWHDFEILPERSGAPKLTLTGGAAEKAASLGIDAILVTMSHCRTYATATAIAVGEHVEPLPSGNAP